MSIRGLFYFVLGSAVFSSGAASGQAVSEGVYVAAPQIASETAKTNEGVAAWAVPAGPGATILAANRDADGLVEVHDKLNDEIVVQSGRATFLVGGRVEGARLTAPSEWRGGRMTGGKPYAMGPGEVLWIPAGAPHQALVPNGGDVRYLAFKFEAQPGSK